LVLHGLEQPRRRIGLAARRRDLDAQAHGLGLIWSPVQGEIPSLYVKLPLPHV
jgi:hypothetical protein